MKLALSYNRRQPLVAASQLPGHPMPPTTDDCSPPESSRSIVRSLLPVLVNVALLGAMIASGIHRNRTRLGDNRSRLDDAVRLIQGYADSAAGFLEQSQGAGGSWQGGGDEATTTVHVLLSLKDSPYASRPFFAQGLGFVRALTAEGATPPPNVRLTAWLLLGGEALPDEMLREPLEERSGASSETEEKALRRVVTRAVHLTPPPMEVGSLSPDASLLVAYLLTLRAPSGETVDADWVRTLLARFRDSVGPEPWGEVEAATLAAFVKTQSEVCLLATDPCQELNTALGALMARRRPDGSWEASGDLEGYAVSPAETTAMVVAALEAFQRILEVRGGVVPAR